MILPEKLILIDKFLSGTLDDDDLKMFESCLLNDTEFNTEVQRQTSLDADLFSISSFCAMREDEDVVQHYLAHSALLSPEESEMHEEQSTYSQREWDEIISGAFIIADENETQKTKVTPFTKYAKYLIAAGFATMVFAAYSAKDFIFEQLGTDPLSKAVSHAQRVINDTIPGENFPDHDTILQFEKSTIIIEQNSRANVLITEQGKTPEIHLFKGSAAFYVDKEKDGKIALITPEAMITSRDAVALVSAQPDVTIISVDSGSVKVNLYKRGVSGTVLAGSTVSAGSDSIIPVGPGATAPKIRARKLLDQFVKRTSIDIPEMDLNLGDEIRVSGSEHREIHTTGTQNETSIVNILKLSDINTTDLNLDSVANFYLDNFSSGARADAVLFSFAERIRLETKDYFRAIDWYERLIRDFPDTPFKEDALYRIGWCIVQERIENRKSNLSEKERLLRPDGQVF